MASAHAPLSETLSLEKHLICSICMDQFQNPVTTACGHTFCKSCLHCNFEYNDRVCPLCKHPQSKTPQVNIVLKNIQRMIKPASQDANRFNGGPGEVACDICTEQRLKAEKSCLVCLVSYCSTHLQKHSSSARLKGHKLVEPIKNLDERACLQHGRPLELYSKKEERCICVRCMEESQEEVVSTEEEWKKRKAMIDKTKMGLQEKIQKRKTLLDEINASLKSCTDQIENEWLDVEAVFTAVISLVENAKSKALQPLKDRRQDVENEAKDLTDALQAEISRFEKSISELEDITAFEDHILFLQSYPPLEGVDNIKDWCEIDFDTSLCFGTMRETTTTLLEEIQDELEKLTSTELRRVSQFAADIKLDPATAHRRLILSDDGKEVKDGGKDVELDDTPERFDLFGSVLGVNSLTSGRAYWEVDVSNKTGWDLGVAQGDANRKGRLSLSPDNGYWATVHYAGEKYAAMTAPPSPLSLKEKPKKVGVFVDCEEGLVSFYDVTAHLHIYSFTGCFFNGKIFPYFSPHTKEDEKNADPLIIDTIERLG